MTLVTRVPVVGTTVAICFTAVLSLAAPTASATTGTAQGATNLGSYSLSAQHIKLDGSGECIDAVMDVAVQPSMPNVYWSIEWTVAPAGATPAAYGSAYGTGAKSSGTEYVYCPAVYRPANIVRGTVDFTYDAEDGSTMKESAAFQFEVGVTRAPTQTVVTKVTRDSFGNVQVTGKVTTTSAEYGRVGAYGTVHLFVQGPKNRWIRIGEGSASGGLGDLVAYSVKPVTSKRAVFRVDFLGTDWTEPSKSKPVASAR